MVGAVDEARNSRPPTRSLAVLGHWPTVDVFPRIELAPSRM
jgi:hypothetical protein